MIKLSQILNEEVESVKLNRFEKRTLLYMCQEKINPINILPIYEFLVEKLFMKNEEEIVKIIKLYKNNFSYENVKIGECEKIGETIDLPKNEDYDEAKIVLGMFLSVNPYLIDANNTNDTYLGTYLNLLDDDEYLVGTYQEARNMAKQRIWDIIDQQGYSYFDEDWLYYYVEVDHQSAKYDAEERAKDDALHYDDEELRGMIYVSDEYDGLIGDREYEEEELKEKITEYKIVNFKLEKLYKEKKIIEREIETLGFSLDYDDEDGYNEMYNIDISEMTNTLHKLETVIFEYLSYNEQAETEISKLEEDIKKSTKEMSKYEGEELQEMVIEELSEMYLQDYLDSPMEYIESSGLSISEAESEGMISIDEDTLINDHILDDGLASVLATYDGISNTQILNGIRYHIYRTN